MLTTVNRHPSITFPIDSFLSLQMPETENAMSQVENLKAESEKVDRGNESDAESGDDSSLSNSFDSIEIVDLRKKNKIESNTNKTETESIETESIETETPFDRFMGVIEPAVFLGLKGIDPMVLTLLASVNQLSRKKFHPCIAEWNQMALEGLRQRNTKTSRDGPLLFRLAENERIAIFNEWQIRKIKFSSYYSSSVSDAGKRVIPKTPQEKAERKQEAKEAALQKQEWDESLKIAEKRASEKIRAECAAYDIEYKRIMAERRLLAAQSTAPTLQTSAPTSQSIPETPTQTFPQQSRSVQNLRQAKKGVMNNFCHLI